MLTGFSFSMYAQNTFSGHIHDVSSGEPLYGATIYIPDLKMGTITDSVGYYHLTNLPSGKLLIQVSFIGYANLIKTIEIFGHPVFDFKLKPSVTELKEIIVTGISAASDASKDPIAHSFVSNEVLKQNSFTNVVDAIAKRPGISQITSGPAISKPVIRGLGYNRVITLNNGQPQEGQQWGDEHGIEIDASAVDRVEIIKGPGSLMYGSDAMAGVINFLPPKPVPQGVISGHFSGNYQSNNNHLGVSFFNAGNLNGNSWQFNISKKLAGNYRNQYDGKVYNSGFNEFDFSGYAGMNRKWGFSHLHFSRFSQNTGIVEGERDSAGNFLKLEIRNGNIEEVPVTETDLKGYDIGYPKQKIEHLAFSLNNNFIFKSSNLTFHIGYQQNIRKEFEDPFETDPGLFFDLKTMDYNLKYFIPAISGWDIATGISGKYQENKNKGTEFLIPEYNLVDLGVFVVAKKSFDQLSLSGGIRYDIRRLNAMALFLDAKGMPVNNEAEAETIKFTTFESNPGSFSGSAGTTWQVSDRTLLKLNVSKGYRAPNIAELGSNGVHEGTFRYEIGNPDLKSETSMQIDAGTTYSGDHTSFEISIFRNAITNYIFIKKLQGSSGGDSIPDPSNPIPAYRFIQTKAWLYGGEAVLDIHPHPLHWLHFENSISLVYSRQDNEADSTKYLPLTPAPVFRSELRGNFDNKDHTIQNVFVKLGVTYTFSQKRAFTAFDTETPTNSYGLFEAGVGVDFVSKKGKILFNLVFLVDNLFDKAYQSHLSRLKYAPENPATGRRGIFDMGRNVSFKIKVPYSIK